MGVSTTTTAPSNVEPTTLTNSIGLAQLSTDSSQLYLVYAGSATQSPIALGSSNFPGSTLGTVAYELAIYAPNSAANTYYIQVTNVSTNATYATSVSGNSSVVPQSNSLLTFRSWKTNNTGTQSVGFDICSIYIETDV
jgi:hypothetical protein